MNSISFCFSFFVSPFQKAYIHTRYVYKLFCPVNIKRLFSLNIYFNTQWYGTQDLYVTYIDDCETRINDRFKYHFFSPSSPCLSQPLNGLVGPLSKNKESGRAITSVNMSWKSVAHFLTACVVPTGDL